MARRFTTVADEGQRRVVAVLGPTNTGKTHLAVDRMLAHRSGMIGFPLRLLAREIYDRIVARRGPGVVALITGEERIVPARPSYFVATVEAMPLDRSVAFLAVDEIQLAADPERGHVFTDRLLRARGRDETMFLGADTILPHIRRLVAGVEFVRRPRFSKLSYVGANRITRLPRRTAVVAFSAAEVYAIAELLRRQRGGTAVVLGALSPRTRNAQVAMYQAGEVDYLVATDAIGMGLNMDVDHVAFASLVKFDGRAPRRLRAPEIAQIAGRAGRHTRDGTFGVTADAAALDAATVARIEEHRFDRLRALRWRNSDLDFTSLGALIRSLEAKPPMSGLRRVGDADDHRVLATLAGDDDIAAMAASGDGLHRLWEVCQVPDFRKVMADSHSRLLGRIYRHLMGEAGVLPTAWMAPAVDRLDRSDGDIDTLVARIAHIRTWTYVAQRPAWLDDAGGWQDRTRAIEDRLSDALHERLTQRFVDRRAAIWARWRDRPGGLLAAVRNNGEVLVEGHAVGQLDGFRFVPDGSGDEARSLRAVAEGALRAEVANRAARLIRAADSAFALDAAGGVRWEGARVAAIAAGESVLGPRIDVVPSDLLSNREGVRRRLAKWLRGELDSLLAPLARLRDAGLAGPGRGLAYQLVEGLGSVPAHQVHDLVPALDAAARRDLARLGVRLGREAVYVRSALKPGCIRARALLWAIHHGVDDLPPLPEGRVSVAVDGAAPAGFYAALGFAVLGPRAVRVDMVERLGVELRRLARGAPFVLPAALLTLVGGRAEDSEALLAALGYRAVDGDDGRRFLAAPRGRHARRGKGRSKAAAGAGRRQPTVDPRAPFAKLAALRPSGPRTSS